MNTLISHFNQCLHSCIDTPRNMEKKNMNEMSLEDERRAALEREQEAIRRAYEEKQKEREFIREVPEIQATASVGGNYNRIWRTDPQEPKIPEHFT